MTRVAVALGSNLGNRRAHIDWAVERLGAYLAGLRVSSVVETEPVDVPDVQPPYLNAVVAGETALSAADLMALLMSLEREQGRIRPAARAARTLDLDLILYGRLVVQRDGIEIPHPRFRERAFVLQPLAEIAPDMIDPVTGRTVAELAQGLR